VSPVKYELGFYISEDAILHSHCRENFKSYTVIVSYRFEKARVWTFLISPTAKGKCFIRSELSCIENV
jgi:hypothetical protein